jgi:manganese transport protein
VLSQVVLSIALPFPMIALLIFTRRTDLMGRFANGRLTHLAGLLGAAVVLLLNAFLVLQILGVGIPGLPGGS